jgi:hypothetical protein
MPGRIKRSTSGLAVDVGLTTPLVLDFCGKAVGDRLSVPCKPLSGVAVRGAQAGELQLDALDIRLVMVDLAIQLASWFSRRRARAAARASSARSAARLAAIAWSSSSAVTPAACWLASSRACSIARVRCSPSATR